MADAATFESIDRGNSTLIEDINHFARYRPMLSSIASAILSALFVPLLIMFLIWQLSPAYEMDTLRGAIRNGLINILPMVIATSLLAKLMGNHSPAEKHFRWSKSFCSGVHVALWVLLFVGLPCRFFAIALSTYSEGVASDSLGRVFFIGSLAATAFGLWWGGRRINRGWDQQLSELGLRMERAERRRRKERLLSGGSVDVNLLTTEPMTAFFRRIALGLLPIVAIVFAGLSAVGFHFTAFEMSTRGLWIFLVALAIAITAGFVSRLLLTTQFRVKLRQLDRNEEGQIDKDESINIKEISSQIDRLVRVTAVMALIVAAWQTWSTVSPTISYLENIEVWQSANQSDETGTPLPVTPRELLMGAGLLVMTFVLSRNLPGLLEITLLDRLPLDKGGRYAISFVFKYLVALVGMLTAFHLIGFAWSSVQWLAAGLTFGLGFGLQEIFANLISGIIILIERPVRVGDLVTVNGTTGTVAQMQLRATTIRDLDHRELIVPNKKFVTEDVMNWTLSDSYYRAIFSVGVAYGSDTVLVYDTLHEVAEAHPLIFRTPRPEILFKSFGDSTLDFELRVIIPSREQLAQVQHELHMAIDKAFRDKKIEIAFPQREIRVRHEDASAITTAGFGRSEDNKAA